MNVLLLLFNMIYYIIKITLIIIFKIIHFIFKYLKKIILFDYFQSIKKSYYSFIYNKYIQILFKYILCVYNIIYSFICKIITCIIIILNHIIPLNLYSLFKYYYLNNNKNNYNNNNININDNNDNNIINDNNKIYFIKINHIIFKEKSLDIIITFYSFFRLLTINFWIVLIRKKFAINKVFPLFFKYKIKDNNNNNNNEFNYENLKMKLKIKKHIRLKLLSITNKDILCNIYIFIQIIFGLFNPYSSLKVIKDILIYFYTVINHKEIKLKLIINKFINKSHKSIVFIFFFDFIYFPMIIFLNIFGIWTMPLSSNLIPINKKQLNKLKNFKLLSSKYLEHTTYKLSVIYYLNNLTKVFKSFIIGYILIFKFIFIHITIFRSFTLWYDFFKRKKQKFSTLIHENYSYALKEILFIHFLFIVTIIEPWNSNMIFDFFKKKTFKLKLLKFIEIIQEFIFDIFNILLYIFLIVSLIDLVPTVQLTIRTFKKNFIKRDIDYVIYNTYYKSKKFSYELRKIYYHNLYKLLIAILFILDILLLTRIKYLFKRGIPFFKKFIFLNYRRLQRLKISLLNIFCFNKYYNRIKKNKKKDILSHQSYYVILKICKYLTVKDIYNLNLVNKKIHMKTNINNIWEKIFYKIYKPKLEQSLSKQDYTIFNPDKFNNYKETCKNCYFIIIQKDENRKKILRDRMINYGRIIEEETIESVLNLPNLLLFFPWKIIGIFLYTLNYLMYKYLSSLSNKNLNSFIDSILQTFKVPEILGEYNINNFFIKIEDHVFEGILLFFFNFFLVFVSTALNLEMYFVKIVCLAKITVDIDPNYSNIHSITDKIKTLPVWKVFLQLFVCFFVIFVRYLISISPSLYFIFIDLKFKPKKNLLENFLFFYDIFYNEKLIIIIQIIFGKYFLNIVFWTINYCLIQLFTNLIARECEIFFYNLVLEIFEFLIWSSPLDYICIFYFPFTFLIGYLKLSFLVFGVISNDKKFIDKLSDYVLNGISLILGLIPFYLCYYCFDAFNMKKNFMNGFVLLFYAIYNLNRCGKVIDSNNINL